MRGKMFDLATDPFSGPAFIGSCILFTCLLGVGLFDFIALASNGKIATISSVIQAWSAQYPMVPIMAGIIIGHLFFPTRQTGVAIPPPNQLEMPSKVVK